MWNCSCAAIRVRSSKCEYQVLPGLLRETLLGTLVKPASCNACVYFLVLCLLSDCVSVLFSDSVKSIISCLDITLWTAFCSMVILTVLGPPHMDLGCLLCCLCLCSPLVNFTLHCRGLYISLMKSGTE